MASLMLSACGSASAQPPTAPGPSPHSPAATIGLPPTWTVPPTSTEAPTTIPSDTLEPSATSTPRPTLTRRPTYTPSSTPDLSTPLGVVQAAFAAHLQGDETTLEALYDHDGKTFCKLTFTTIGNCISVAYRIRNLNRLVEWHVEPDDSTTQTQHVALLFVVTHWAESDQVWVQLFSLTDTEGRWKIYESGTIVYPFDS